MRQVKVYIDNHDCPVCGVIMTTRFKKDHCSGCNHSREISERKARKLVSVSVVKETSTRIMVKLSDGSVIWRSKARDLFKGE